MERQVEVEPYSYFLTIFLPRSQNPPHIIYDLYNQVGYNCFIAAGIYMLITALFLPDQTEQAQGVHGALIPPAGLGMLLLQHSKTLSGEEKWLFP
jgi:hypothetical protein